MLSPPLSFPLLFPLKWNFVPPDYVGGLLIEVAQRYDVEGDEWVPVPGDPQ